MAIVAFHHDGLLSSCLQNLALRLHSSAIRVRRDGQVRDEPIIAKQRTKQSRTQDSWPYSWSVFGSTTVPVMYSYLIKATWLLNVILRDVDSILLHIQERYSQTHSRAGLPTVRSSTLLLSAIFTYFSHEFYSSVSLFTWFRLVFSSNSSTYLLMFFFKLMNVY